MNVPRKSNSDQSALHQASVETARIHVWLETRLEAFAIGRGIPQEELSTRISEFLFALQSRTLLRSETDMRVLPRVSSSKKPKGQRTKVARHSNARSYVRKSAKTKKVSGIKAYWAKMTKAERSAEMLRRRTAKKSAA